MSNSIITNVSPYIGRFAPSPTGDLHFGSLVTALGSYLQAKKKQGKWYVRIDDIDTAREVPGAASRILKTLAHYGLHWDGKIIYQSQRHDLYHDTLAQLKQCYDCYYCRCTRQRINAIGGYYDAHCRNLGLSSTAAALRIIQSKPVYGFYDQLQGDYVAPRSLAEEDFIIVRKDNLFAYNLVVVIDDHDQAITEVVRGADLIAPTVRQISLHHLLAFPVPDYMHLPLVLNRFHNKLSKQNHTPPLPINDPRPILIDALNFLSQPTIINWQDLTTEQLLNQAVQNWQLNSIQPNGRIVTNYD
ncbi:tRNA glutamyl-Q(34) synthetase GluQRS [Arsenophonus nasoniae]|uniref:Glutamyl-Q tRNA(Asp) synthetase n=1 Tax=Arsenophonus nasoniae TaxID=638 RepID=A0AA95GT10_9GAMM|nr:tRNA glutamyl-Q(34) synthetase GluQRS [Arsenophonus nasoniae]WGL94836.1 tRNA glutamyl-Q(34) synthetase GluQRS [Arsenophonus nasoniae]WGM02234.1 tRNA glutamyl-Q(34) synthetase GluQRS [Arsenophonus nasoniae]